MEARFIIDLIKDRKDKIVNLNKQKVLKNGDDFKENKIRIDELNNLLSFIEQKHLHDIEFEKENKGAKK